MPCAWIPNSDGACGADIERLTCVDWLGDGAATQHQISDQDLILLDLQAFIAVRQKYRATAAALVAKGLMNSAEQEESLPA